MRVAPGALGALAAVLILFLPLSLSTPLVRETVTNSPSAAIPVTLAAGASGSTTLGTSATTATESYLTLGAIATEILKVTDGAGTPDWKVSIKALSASGFAITDSLTLVLKLGGTTQTQVVVSGLSGITQSTGTPITLPNGGGPIQVLASGLLILTGSVSLQFIITPSTASAPTLTYTWSLSLS